MSRMSTVLRTTSSSLRLNTSRVSFSKNGTTATPSMGTQACYTSDNITSYIEFSVTNNDTVNAEIEASSTSTFTAVTTQRVASVAPGATATFVFSGYSSPPGSQTFYGRATAQGRLTSASASRTQSIPGCLLV